MVRTILAFDYTHPDELREVVRDGSAFYDVKTRPGRSDAYGRSQEKIPAGQIVDRIRWTGLNISKYRRDRRGISADGVAWLDRHDPGGRPEVPIPVPDIDAMRRRDEKRQHARTAFGGFGAKPALQPSSSSSSSSTPAASCVCASGFAVVTPVACRGKSNDAIGDLVWKASEKNDGGRIATPAEQPPLEMNRGATTFVYYDSSEGDFWPEQAIGEGFTVMPVGYGLGRKGSRVTVYYVHHPTAAKMKAVRAHLKKYLPHFF